MMKIFGFFLLILTIIPGETQQRTDAPAGLMIEFIREPENVPVLDLKPEFSWIVPVNANFQTGFQILVASSKEKLEKDIADIWDSKKILSKRSSEIEFGGSDLAFKSTFYWKVRIWNDKNKPSKYSVIQSFTTGTPAGYATTRNRFMKTLIAPQKLVKIADQHYFVDFGKDAFGTLMMELSSIEDDTIIVHLGEKTSGQNKIDRNPEGSLRYHRVLLPVKPGKEKYTLNLPPDIRNTAPPAIQLPDSFGVITPFRYCELENCHFALKSSDIRQEAFCYFFNDEMSSFTCSDTILNKVWDICKYSMKATSFAGIYIDGDRERIPYEGDAYINQLGHYYTDREYSLARLSNEHFIKHPTWPTEWILQTVPMFYNDFMFTGNIESVKNYYEELKHKTLIALSRADGLISSKNCTAEIMTNLGFSGAKEPLKDIVDWPPSQKDTGWKLLTTVGERDGYEMVEINTVVNAFYFQGLKLMSELAGRLGNKEDSVFYQKQASKVKMTINEKLLNKTTGIYIDGESSQHSSLHANMMALAFNLVPEENKKAVIDFIKSRGMACSVYGAQYLLEGLYNEGEADYAFILLTATNDRSWWNMIRAGSTITMEAWDMKYKPNSDWNHAWGAAPANIIPRHMWGIAPVEPGYAKAIIKPQLSRLRNSKISVPTIRGNIVAEFKLKGKTQEYSITIPANMECDFVLPNIKNTFIVFNGQKIRKETGKISLKPGLNKLILAGCQSETNSKVYKADVIVYGGTSSAVTTAVQISRMGKSVIIVSPDKHIGGLSSSGLGFTDTGKKEVIGGLAREFYQLIYQHYQKSESWKWQKQSEYGNKGQGNPAMDGENRTMWIFEPHAAEEAFEQLIEKNNIRVFRDEWLERDHGVIKKNGTIISIQTLSGKTFKGKIFVDATYEGDLMASTGVSYHVGREANSLYGEEWNGIQVGDFPHKHHDFDNMSISPYIIPGDSSSGMLPRISTKNPGIRGEGDTRIQAYCFRLCLTKNENNRLPFTRPDGYDSTQYELLIRIYNAGWRGTYNKFDPIPNLKTDVNNHGPFSFDNIGMNYDFPEAGYERRKEIINEHISYQKGLLYFIASDPRIPAEVRDEMEKWGYSKDEFRDNSNWPYNIYVREARRMKGEYVMTENDVLGKRKIPHPIGMGSYNLDSHNTQRYIKADGFVENEGDIELPPKKPYLIDLGSIMPKREECQNLLVTVCISSSHIAFGSIRMEPVFMILGQSAGTVAAMAIEKRKSIYALSYDEIKTKLESDGQILKY